jgi:hypothetical protein
VLLLLKSEADWIGKSFTLSTRLHITNTHREKRESFEYTPERETKERFIIAALLSHRLYHVFVFIALKTNAQRKQQH